MNNENTTIKDNRWSLFLDRDGVINIERHLKYINHWDEFVFYEGVLEAFRIFAARFRYIFVVSNQRGVSRGLTDPADLACIHNNMSAAIKTAGGRIDQIYFCTDMESTSPNRKPNPGMGLQAKKDFEAIDFSRSIMVGDKLTDMEFGRNLGCKTIFLPTTNPDVCYTDERIDFVYNSLLGFALDLDKIITK